MKILICGTQGSGKSTLAEPFSKLLGGVWLNEEAILKHYNASSGIATKMRYLADGVVLAGKIPVIDCTCSYDTHREIIDADYIVWMDAVDRNEFEPLTKYNYHVTEWFDDTHTQLCSVVKSWMERNV